MLALLHGRTTDRAHPTRTMETVPLMEDLALALPPGTPGPVRRMREALTRVVSMRSLPDQGHLPGVVPMLAAGLRHGVVVHLHLAIAVRIVAMMHRRRVRATQHLHQARMAALLRLVLPHQLLAAGVTVHRLRGHSMRPRQADIDPMMLLHQQPSVAGHTMHQHPLWRLLPAPQPTTEAHATKRARLVLRFTGICFLPEYTLLTQNQHNNLSSQNQACTILLLFSDTIGSCMYAISCFCFFHTCFLCVLAG